MRFQWQNRVLQEPADISLGHSRVGGLKRLECTDRWSFGRKQIDRSLVKVKKDEPCILNFCFAHNQNSLSIESQVVSKPACGSERIKPLIGDLSLQDILIDFPESIP